MITLDFSNPVTFVVGLLVAALVLVAFYFYAREILVDAQLEADRRRKQQEDRDQLDRGRRL